MLFAAGALLLLGIERVAYGFIFHFTEAFKEVCQKGPLRSVLAANQGEFWKVAQQIGVVIKVFQFGIIGYDVLLRRSVAVAPPWLLCVGFVLLCIGQALNWAVFKAIGAKGVYYGSELGYDVPWVEGFPYNMGISDPQYWGVVLFVWGAYAAIAPSGNIFSEHFVVPWLESFWYLVSMKLLEHRKNGTLVLGALGFRAPVA